jgi:hypothetical protein
MDGANPIHRTKSRPPESVKGRAFAAEVDPRAKPGASAAVETAFYPRIINPARFSRAVIFAADETVRDAAGELAERMPWTRVEVARDPRLLERVPIDGATVYIYDDTGLIVAETEQFRGRSGDRVHILLSANEIIHSSPPALTRAHYPYTSKADLIFAVDREDFAPKTIIASAVRCAEDLLNITSYSKERRFIFLIVDDEPRWFSQFLPVLYGIIGQRADVMIARTYEEALRFLFGADAESGIDPNRFLSCGHGDDVVCLIADLYFPKGEDMNSPVGRDLIKTVKTYYPRIPIIIASKSKEAESLKDRALILPKGDPGSLELLKAYIHDYTGMGDFLIRNPEGGTERRIRDIVQLKGLLDEAGQDSAAGARLRRLLERYGEKDFFSTWFYMHGFRTLGDILRPRRDRDLELVNEVRSEIEKELQRLNATPLVIEGERIFDLHDLRRVLKRIDPPKIQRFSDNDVFSTWLDSKSFPELAEELRPIHGSGRRLRDELVRTVEKWISIYRDEGRLAGASGP